MTPAEFQRLVDAFRAALRQLDARADEATLRAAVDASNALRAGHDDIWLRSLERAKKCVVRT